MPVPPNPPPGVPLPTLPSFEGMDRLREAVAAALSCPPSAAATLLVGDADTRALAARLCQADRSEAVAAVREALSLGQLRLL